jgi:hypothetical protein
LHVVCGESAARVLHAFGVQLAKGFQHFVRERRELCFGHKQTVNRFSVRRKKNLRFFLGRSGLRQKSNV